MLSVVATRYARALADAVLAPGSGLQPASVSAQLQSVDQMLDSNAELKHVMLSPAVASSKKRGVMGQLGAALGLDKKVQNFLYVLIDHRRMGQLSEIREAFEAALDEGMGLVKAGITSAQPLADSDRAALEQRLAALTGKKIRAGYSTDPSLIGGVVARIGSTVYDGSVRGQFEALRRKLVTKA